MSQIRPYHFDQYKAHRLAAVTPVTTNMELRTLRSMMSTAVRWRMIDSNPFLGLELARVPETTPAFFSKEALAKFVGSIRHIQLRDIVIFAVATGMRRSEITNLTWDRVDLGKRVIHIESAGNFKTKHGKRRSIAINETATLILQTRSLDRKGEYVFSEDDRPVNESWLTHKFGKAVRKAQLEKRLHFHSLRHTYASWLAQANVSIYQISKLLGHSDVKTTQTFYTHLLPDEMHQQVAMIDIGFSEDGGSSPIR